MTAINPQVLERRIGFAFNTAMLEDAGLGELSSVVATRSFDEPETNIAYWDALSMPSEQTGDVAFETPVARTSKYTNKNYVAGLRIPEEAMAQAAADANPASNGLREQMSAPAAKVFLHHHKLLVGLLNAGTSTVHYGANFFSTSRVLSPKSGTVSNLFNGGSDTRLQVVDASDVDPEEWVKIYAYMIGRALTVKDHAGDPFMHGARNFLFLHSTDDWVDGLVAVNANAVDGQTDKYLNPEARLSSRGMQVRTAPSPYVTQGEFYMLVDVPGMRPLAQTRATAERISLEGPEVHSHFGNYSQILHYRYGCGYGHPLAAYKGIVAEA